MSACTTDCRACTGKRFEHCKCCHRTFGGNSLGDAHRVLVETYVVAKPTLKSRNSEARHFATEEDVPKGWVTQSVGNIRKRCLTDAELAAKGWRIVNGVVRGPQWADNPWTKKDELAEEIESVLDAEVRRMDDDTLLPGEDSEALPLDEGETPGRDTTLDLLDELLPLDAVIAGVDEPVVEPAQLEYGGMEVVHPGLVEVPETTKPIPPVGGMDLDALIADWDAAAADLSL